MAITFNSKAASVTMLDANARQILDILGKDMGVRGVITAAEAPAAIARLRAAVEAQGPDRSSNEDGETGAASVHVPLKSRVQPFIDMLEKAHAAGGDILWGV